MRQIMKKIIVLVLCLGLTFVFMACGESGGQDEEGGTSVESEQAGGSDGQDAEAAVGEDGESASEQSPEEGSEEGSDEESGDRDIQTTGGEQSETVGRDDHEADLGALQESAASSDAPYTGTYVEVVAGRGIIIVNKPDDKYSVTISWSDSAFETYQWSFTGDFDSEGALEYSDCIKKDIVYEEGEQGKVTKVYENGTGRLVLTEDGLVWEDDMDHTGDDASFIFTGE